MADTKPVLMKISDTCILGMVNDVPVLQLDWDPITESLMYYTYDENTQNGKPTGWHEWHDEEAASLHYKYFIEGPLTTRVVDVAAQKANPARYERMQKMFAEVEKRAERLDEVMSTREALSIENQAVENELLKLEIEAKREQLKESQINFSRKTTNRILQ